MTQKLPDPSLVQRLLDLDDEDQIVWRLTRRKATVPAIFTEKTDIVLIGRVAHHGEDVRHLLETGGDWPQVAFERPELHVRRGRHEMSLVRYHRELARQELAAIQEAVPA